MNEIDHNKLRFIFKLVKLILNARKITLKNSFYKAMMFLNKNLSLSRFFRLALPLVNLRYYHDLKILWFWGLKLSNLLGRGAKNNKLSAFLSVHLSISFYLKMVSSVKIQESVLQKLKLSDKRHSKQNIGSLKQCSINCSILCKFPLDYQKISFYSLNERFFSQRSFVNNFQWCDKSKF